MVVPALLAQPRVLKALRGLLLGDATLTARLSTVPANLGGGPAIYTESYVPPTATTDYLTIGPFTERSESGMGGGAKWGSALTTQIKLVSMHPDIGHCLGTLDRLMALLHGVPLTVDDYSHGWCLLSLVVDAYSEKLAGGVYWHYPTLWEIHVGQPT
jgi:hypothetical protein